MGKAEAGGQRAERQWRPSALGELLNSWQSKPEGREPKGNGDMSKNRKLLDVPSEAGGQRAERQWRLDLFSLLVLWCWPRSRRAESRKAMETKLCHNTQHGHYAEAGGQRAERQWRRRFRWSNVHRISWKPERREPKGNGDASFLKRVSCRRHRKPERREPKGNGDLEWEKWEVRS